MDTAATGDTFDISNNDRLGKSEVRMTLSLFYPRQFIREASCGMKALPVLPTFLGGAGADSGGWGSLPDRL